MSLWGPQRGTLDFGKPPQLGASYALLLDVDLRMMDGFLMNDDLPQDTLDWLQCNIGRRGPMARSVL